MSILVATDFSPCSLGAVRLAAALARRRRVPLWMVHAVEPLPMGDPLLPVVPSGWASGLLTTAEQSIRREAGRLEKEGLPVETRVIVGEPARVVLDLARERGIDLIVVGTHGRRGAAHLFLGSVAETVVRRAECPVLVAPGPVADPSAWEGRAPLHLAVATDGAVAGQSALSWAGQFARGGGCDLSLIRFYFPSEEMERYGLDDLWNGPRRDAELVSLLRRDLHRDAHDLMGHAPLRMRFRAIAHEASEELREESAMLGADAIVIAVPRHRWKGWTAVAAGPVLRTSGVPVFCVPEAEPVALSGQGPLRSILVAIDLSPASRDVVAAAYRLLQARGGRVELCTVHEVGVGDALAHAPLAPLLDDEQRTTLESYLRSLVPSDVERSGITTHVSVLEGATAPESILAAAERFDVDLVALGSHGRSGLKRALLGSVAEEVARHSKRPVLLVRSRADHAPSA